MVNFYISIKMVIALLITFVPFYFIFFVRPKLKKQGGWKNSFDFARNHPKFFARLKKKLLLFGISFSNGLACNKSIRKIYLLMTLVAMLIVETVDTNVSHNIAGFVIEKGKVNYDFYTEYRYLSPMLTHPVATISSFFITFLFLSYRIGNHVLTTLHNSNGKFILLLLAAVAVCYLYDGRFILFGEILYILSFFSYCYPNFQAASLDATKEGKENKTQHKAQNKKKHK